MNIVENLDYLDVSIILHIYSCKCFSYMKLPTNVFLRWHYQGPEGKIYRVLNMFFRPAHNFFWFYIGLPFLAHRCITMRRWVAYIHDPDMTLNFDLKVKFIGFLTCFCVRPITFFLVLHWLTILGTWVTHHETMCCVHSWARFDVYLWPQGHIYRILSCLHVLPLTSVSFDIGIPF